MVPLGARTAADLTEALGLNSRESTLKWLRRVEADGEIRRTGASPRSRNNAWELVPEPRPPTLPPCFMKWVDEDRTGAGRAWIGATRSPGARPRAWDADGGLDPASGDERLQDGVRPASSAPRAGASGRATATGPATALAVGNRRGSVVGAGELGVGGGTDSTGRYARGVVGQAVVVVIAELRGVGDVAGAGVEIHRDRPLLRGAENAVPSNANPTRASGSCSTPQVTSAPASSRLA